MTDSREHLITRLSRLHQILSTLESLDHRVDALRLNHAPPPLRVEYETRFVMNFLWGFLLGNFLVGPVAFIVAGHFAQSLSGDAVSIPFIVAFAIYCPGSFILAILLTRLWNRRIRKKNQAAQERHNQDVQAGNHAFQQAVEPLHNDLQIVVHDYNVEYPDWQTSNYLRNSYDVAGLLRVLNDYRATTLADAINVYAQDIHNHAMQNGANAQAATAYQQLLEQQRATKVARINGIVQATLAGATIGAINAQGAATRAHMTRLTY